MGVEYDLKGGFTFKALEAKASNTTWNFGLNSFGQSNFVLCVYSRRTSIKIPVWQ
jgi:hypothetical protein